MVDLNFRFIVVDFNPRCLKLKVVLKVDLNPFLQSKVEFNPVLEFNQLIILTLTNDFYIVDFDPWFPSTQF
jgi:branched-subunit amino acid transport protein